MKNRVVKNLWGKIGVDGLLAFVPPSSGMYIYYVLYMCKDTSFLCTEICNGMYQLIWNTVLIGFKPEKY